MPQAVNQKTIFSTYLNELTAIARQGDAREESFYPALADRLTETAHATGKTHVHVTTLPKPTEGGNPDFRLWNGADRIVGYVEAKKPTEERLDLVENAEQLMRYRATFPNLILTNFLEFRLYRNGERVQAVRVGRPHGAQRAGHNAAAGKPSRTRRPSRPLFSISHCPRHSPRNPSPLNWRNARALLREVIGEQFARERNAPGRLSGFFEAFQTYPHRLANAGGVCRSVRADDSLRPFCGSHAGRRGVQPPASRSTISRILSACCAICSASFRSTTCPPHSLGAWMIWPRCYAWQTRRAFWTATNRKGKGGDPIVHF